MPEADHERWMAVCLDLAEGGAGIVSPNPMVGAVLVGTDGTLLGQGWHREYGGPHAERHAIQDAERRYGGDALQNATLYVNLEPCVHFGKTPPCTDIILEKQIPRVVVGTPDPYPKVSGRGIDRLRERHVDVTTGVMETECRRLNEAFLHHVETGRPLVTLKLAQTLDSKVAGLSGESRWITGEPARRMVHHWRATMDGVMVGTGTVLQDDPALTVRHVDGRNPVRVILDRRGRLRDDLKLLSEKYAKNTLVFTSHEARPAYEQIFAERGGRIARVSQTDRGLDLGGILEYLGKEGGREGRPMQSLLVEGGPGIAVSLLEEDLVDRLFLFVAPRLLGAGHPAFTDFGPQQMPDALVFADHEWEIVGDDVLFRGYRRNA
jgi:diaminohydroxyphosphoribosylaminopyrimidine deaminase/5-amino-6-(5-phosphoribosylamino)uracil reductase